MLSSNKRLPLIIDLAFCFVLLPFMIWLLPVERWMSNNMPFVLLFVGWLYIVYFAYRYYAVPWMFRDRRHLMFGVGILIASIAVTYLIANYQFEVTQSPLRRARRLPYAAGGVSDATTRAAAVGMLIHQRAVWFLFVVVAAFSFAVGTLGELHQQIVRRQTLEHEKQKAELALYKVQINPHFLFNTLNTLYGLMLTDIGRAETAFMQFMSLTKYMYTNAERDKVPLRAEIDYIRQYIELQKNRLNEHTRVHFTLQSVNEQPDISIAPMILITFVENALKYGVSAHQDSDIHIDIHVDGSQLKFTAQNPIILRPTKEKSGFGIANCRKRLNLLYPNRHTLEIKEQQDVYSVSLTLQLN